MWRRSWWERRKASTPTPHAIILHYHSLSAGRPQDSMRLFCFRSSGGEGGDGAGDAGEEEGEVAEEAIGEPSAQGRADRVAEERGGHPDERGRRECVRDEGAP